MGKFSRFPLPLAAGDVEDAIPYMRLSFITMTIFSTAAHRRSVMTASAERKSRPGVK